MIAALFTRAYDDVVAVSRFVASFLGKNPPLYRFQKDMYQEALFSLAVILSDQDRNYPASLLNAYLQDIERYVKCRETLGSAKECSPDDSTAALPINGLAKTASYLEAAAMILETIIQTRMSSNLGYTARALREKADINFRVLEIGKGVSDDHPLPRPAVETIVGDYLSALELLKSKSHIEIMMNSNWRVSNTYASVMQQLSDPQKYYGLAEEYSRAAYSGDEFEIAKIFISLGKFYLYSHGWEARYDELPPEEKVRNQNVYKGLIEAEAWFKFVVEDPDGLFDDKKLEPYKIEALVRLSQTRQQLGELELAQGNAEIARTYFDAALNNIAAAYSRAEFEVNRMLAKDWANEGTSMSLRNIYFNALISGAQIKLKIAARLKGLPAGQLTADANRYMTEALNNRELMLFGETKTSMYRTALLALTAQAEGLADPKQLTADQIKEFKERLVSTLNINIVSENNFGLLELQLQALALLIFIVLETTSNTQQAEAEFARLLPFEKISPSLKQRLGLGDKHLPGIPDAFTLVISKLILQPLLPSQIRKHRPGPAQYLRAGSGCHKKICRSIWPNGGC